MLRRTAEVDIRGIGYRYQYVLILDWEEIGRTDEMADVQEA